MKFKTMIAIGVGTLAVGATSLAVVAKVGSNSQIDATSYSKIYLKLNASYWGANTYYYTAHIWGGTGDTSWPGLDLGSGTGTDELSVAIPSGNAGYKHIIICGWNESTHKTEKVRWNYFDSNAMSEGEQYNYFTNDGASSCSSSTKTEGTTYTCTEYAVVDGVKESSALATESCVSTASFTPTNVSRSGYKLNGWFTDEACTTAYVAAAPTADFTLYAKYTAIVIDSYVYFSAPSWSECYVYTYGGSNEFGAWPGTKVTEVTTGANYQGSGIYRVGYNSSFKDTKIIFNKGSGGNKGDVQTYDLTLAAGMFYKLSDQSTGDADKGSGAQVVYDINAARRAVSASGSILAGSVCGISKAKAQTLIDEYDALNATAQGYVNSATDYVYNYSDTSKSVDVTVNYLVAELRVLAASGSRASYVTSTTDAKAWIFGAIAVSGLAVGGLFLALNRKRKEN
jgi:uncharacterized repeat protein (TIGR02543 family)